MAKVIVNYGILHVNGKKYHTFTVTRNGITAKGDNYPGTKKGLRDCKRDAADIVRHLRRTNEIQVIR